MCQLLLYIIAIERLEVVSERTCTTDHSAISICLVVQTANARARVLHSPGSKYKLQTLQSIICFVAGGRVCNRLSLLAVKLYELWVQRTCTTACTYVSYLRKFYARIICCVSREDILEMQFTHKYRHTERDEISARSSELKKTPFKFIIASRKRARSLPRNTHNILCTQGTCNIPHTHGGISSVSML